MDLYPFYLFDFLVFFPPRFVLFSRFFVLTLLRSRARTVHAGRVPEIVIYTAHRCVRTGTYIRRSLLVAYVVSTVDIVLCDNHVVNKRAYTFHQNTAAAVRARFQTCNNSRVALLHYRSMCVCYAKFTRANTCTFVTRSQNGGTWTHTDRLCTSFARY